MKLFSYLMGKKRGEVGVGALILIVLGIVILVVMILGFSIGWSNLWEKINIFGGGVSISDAVTACRFVVTSQSNYDYCQKFHQVNTNGEKEYVNCQDSRIQPNLENNLDCPAGYENSEISARTYCQNLVKTRKMSADKKIRVNGILCSLDVTSNAKEEIEVKSITIDLSEDSVDKSLVAINKLDDGGNFYA